MENSKILSNKPAAVSNWLPIAFLILGAIGFADATYLTTQHFLGMPVACAILKGCEQVTTSHYSLFFGQPVALFGSIYYFSVLVLTALYFQTQKRLFFTFANILTLFGFLISLRFVYLQLFVIGAICIYCMTSAASSTLLFILSLISFKKKKSAAEIAQQ